MPGGDASEVDEAGLKGRVEWEERVLLGSGRDAKEATRPKIEAARERQPRQSCPSRGAFRLAQDPLDGG
jgi:hypothetical protein